MTKTEARGCDANRHFVYIILNICTISILVVTEYLIVFRLLWCQMVINQSSNMEKFDRCKTYMIFICMEGVFATSTIDLW